MWETGNKEIQNQARPKKITKLDFRILNRRYKNPTAKIKDPTISVTDL